MLRDARKANRALKKHIKSTSNYGQEEVDFGQRKAEKKSRKLQDALPLVPKHLRKQLVGGKDHSNANQDFYKAFKYIYVDIPEPEEDFPCESFKPIFNAKTIRNCHKAAL